MAPSPPPALATLPWKALGRQWGQKQAPSATACLALGSQPQVSAQALHSRSSYWMAAGFPAAHHRLQAQTHSRGTSHPGPAPAVPTPSVFQGRMCLVWIRQCWPRNRRSGQSALRSRVTGVITTVSCGSQAGTPIPRESLGEAGRWEPHTKFPLWEKGGPGTGSFSLRETQVGVDSEGTTGLCLDFGPSPPGLAPLLGTQQPGPQPF